MIRQMGHVCFHTNQMDQLISFYRDCLGLPIKFHLYNKEGERMGTYFDCGNSTFIEVFDQALAVKQWGGDMAPLERGSQYRHLCLEVTGLADFKTLLESRGVKVTEIKTGMDHSNQAWIADPDGNAIELMEYTHESLQLRRTAE